MTTRSVSRALLLLISATLATATSTASARADSALLTDFPRDEVTHQIEPMTYKQAKTYCKRKGARLPTLQELARALSPESAFAETVLASRYEPKGETPFFYNNMKYPTPARTLEWRGYYLWTDSTPEHAPSHRYGFELSSGALLDAHIETSELTTVRCHAL